MLESSHKHLFNRYLLAQAYLGWRSSIMGGEVGSVIMEEKTDNFTILTKTSPLDNKSNFSAKILSLFC